MEAFGYFRQSVKILRLHSSSRFTSISVAQYRRNLSTTKIRSSSSPSETSADSQAIDTQIKSSEDKYNELMDKYKRALADSENMRIRLTKQIQDAKVYGIQAFCKDLLEVSDTLRQATMAVPNEAINDQNPHLKNLFDGLVLTKNALEQVFRRHGLETIEPLNSKFDPNFHEALFQKECKNVEAGTVVEVTKIGYKLHNRCIRPALVGVSTKN